MTGYSDIHREMVKEKVRSVTFFKGLGRFFADFSKKKKNKTKKKTNKKKQKKTNKKQNKKKKKKKKKKKTDKKQTNKKTDVHDVLIRVFVTLGIIKRKVIIMADGNRKKK